MPKKSNLLQKEGLAERLKAAKLELAETLKDDDSLAELSNVDISAEKPSPKESISNQLKEEKTALNVEPKLCVTGRSDRKNHKYKTKAFYIHEGLDEHVRTYCRGADITVYNYLISVGLETIKQLDNMKMAEASEIEDTYTKKQT